MFGVGPATRIYLAAGSTDMRKSFEGLYGLVRDRQQSWLQKFSIPSRKNISFKVSIAFWNDPRGSCQGNRPEPHRVWLPT